MYICVCGVCVCVVCVWVCVVCVVCFLCVVRVWCMCLCLCVCVCVSVCGVFFVCVVCFFGVWCMCLCLCVCVCVVHVSLFVCVCARKNFDCGVAVRHIERNLILLNEVKLKAALKIQHCLQFMITCSSFPAHTSGLLNLKILKINK